MNTIFLLPDKSPLVEKLTRWLVTKSKSRATSVTKVRELPEGLMGAGEDHILAQRLLLAIMTGVKTGTTIFNDIPADHIYTIAMLLGEDHDVAVIEIDQGPQHPSIEISNSLVCVVDPKLKPFDLFQRMEAIWKLASEESPDDGDKPRVPGR